MKAYCPMPPRFVSILVRHGSTCQHMVCLLQNSNLKSNQIALQNANREAKLIFPRCSHSPFTQNGASHFRSWKRPAPLVLSDCGWRNTLPGSTVPVEARHTVPSTAENTPPKKINSHEDDRHCSIGNRNSSFAPQPSALSAKRDGDQRQNP